MDGLFNFTASEFIAIRLSIIVALLSTVFLLPVALLTGFIMARKNFAGKSFVESIIHLPLVMPPVTTGYLLLLSLGSKSVIGGFLMRYFGIKLSFSFTAAVLASAFVSFPLIVRSVRTSFEMIDPGLEDASRILGAGRFKTFFRVTLPLSLPGLFSGTVLAFARSLGEFGATITFAGNIEGVTRTLPLAIFTYMQVPGKEISTIRLVLVSILISFFSIVLSEIIIKRIKHDKS